jgi:hypothetical protein
MLFKLLSSLISAAHALLFLICVGGLAFGIGVGDWAPDKAGPIALALYGLSGLTFILAISIYFAPGWSAAILIFVLGGMGTLALWQFVVSGFAPLNLAVAIVELALAGLPFMVLTR